MSVDNQLSPAPDRSAAATTLRHSESSPDFRMSVNVIGELGGQTGMAATIKAYVRALQAAGLRVSTIDGSTKQTIAIDPGVDLQVNITCCEIASHFTVRSNLGKEFFSRAYNIGVWLWESPAFPTKWYDRFAYYDEIWAPTSFIASTLSPISPVPVIRMPCVLEPTVDGSRHQGRRRLGLSDDEFVYLFIFNFHSRYQRKNPLGLIESFKQCFRPGEPAHLIIKCANADFNLDHYREMKRHAEGHRISVYDGRWSGPEMADLMSAGDCYVSLHRAEGLGLTISDAMAAAKPVIATGWSGNMDFMTVANSFPVEFRLIELDKRVAHYRAGEVWAEPSIEHSAELMRYVFENRAQAHAKAEAGRNDIRAHYSVAAVSELMQRRMAVISQRQPFAKLKQLLDTSIPCVDGVLTEFNSLGDYLPDNQFKYEQLKMQLSGIVEALVPRSARLLVVSRGDDELLNLSGARAWHFPLQLDYVYSGYHPKHSEEAIEQLEFGRKQGGDYLVFPTTSFWWLDHYTGFRQYLSTHYKEIHRDESCVLFDLRSRAQETIGQ
jgi:glycosyltransferase involved in cell wall biosynthesis